VRAGAGASSWCYALRALNSHKQKEKEEAQVANPKVVAATPNSKIQQEYMATIEGLTKELSGIRLKWNVCLFECPKVVAALTWAKPALLMLPPSPFGVHLGIIVVNLSIQARFLEHRPFAYVN